MVGTSQKLDLNMILKMFISRYVTLIPLIFVLFIASIKLIDGVDDIKCIEREGHALLSFKHGLQDSFDILSSWKVVNVEDCCHWKGVKCNNFTSHVVELDLRCTDVEQPLSGNIDPSLLQLSHLSYLDLSGNNFAIPIPNYIGSLVNLKYLNLSHTGFFGIIPPDLGNLSSLHALDLNGVPVSDSKSLEWLSHLSSLGYLDLSGINLENASDWMQVVNKLPHLQTLILSSCYLPPPIFPSFPYTNISTTLSKLDLSLNPYLTSSIFLWLSNFSSSLVFLDFSSNDFQGYIPNAFGNMTSLSFINFGSNQLEGPSPKSFWNFCNLHSLDFSRNKFKGTFSDFIQILPQCSLDSLEYLDFSFNNFSGSLPDFSTFSSLKNLDLSSNNFSGKIPQSFGELSNLETWDFSNNQFFGQLPDFSAFQNLTTLSLSSNGFSGSLPDFSTFQNLKWLILSSNEFSGNISMNHGQLFNLEILDFSNNKLSGNLPDFSTFPNLKSLDLSSNEFSGKIPLSLGQLSNLDTLNLETNSLEGIIHEGHFLKLTQLRLLDLSHNSLNLQIHPNWRPPFQLYWLSLSSCNLGPKFPHWLKGQSLSNLDLSNTSISDTIPSWFWNNSFNPPSPSLDLSNNKIRGELPALISENFVMDVVDLRSNEFHGEIPKYLLQAGYVDVSNNKFSGLRNLCDINFSSSLYFLDASNNQLLGELPNCWWNLSQLEILNLANNIIYGEIPSSMSNLHVLQSLHFYNNSFTGQFPHWLKNFTQLHILDLGDNYLSGEIPSWIGNGLTDLYRLSLRSNQFYGELPWSLCHLNSILFLDLSLNNITGVIPRCLHNLTVLKDVIDIRRGYIYHQNRLDPFNNTMATGEMVVTWKGRDFIMKEMLSLLRSIDFSGNHLTGEIPNEITDLVGLVSLNLSRNNLTGEIPPTIGKLKFINSLDLSRNELVGQIPQSLSEIDRLGVLNLSFNRLSGKIPISTQLQSFDAYTYVGNIDLCGFPLPKCFEEQMIPTSTNRKQEVAYENEFSTKGFYISLVVGFIVGFWGICATLIFQTSWRNAYFKFLKSLNDGLTVKMTIFKNKVVQKLFQS